MMSSRPYAIRIDTLADIPGAIAVYDQVGASHRVLLLRALAAGRIGLYEPQRSTSASQLKPYLAALRGRSIIVVGDDDDFPTGPEGWPHADRLLRWATVAFVHGTGARDSDYEFAVQLAEIGDRVLLVECTSANAVLWRDAALSSPNRPAGVVILPPPGTGPHPIAARSEGVQ